MDAEIITKGVGEFPKIEYVTISVISSELAPKFNVADHLNVSEESARELSKMQFSIIVPYITNARIYTGYEIIRELDALHRKKRSEEHTYKPRLQLPQGKLLSTFAGEVAGVMKKVDNVFFRPRDNEIVEVTRFVDKTRNREIIGFHDISNPRLINIFETVAVTYTCVYDKEKREFVDKERSMTESHAKAIRTSDNFIKALRQVDRLFLSPMFFLENKKLVTQKIGYDERFASYTIADCPRVDLLTVEESKKIIDTIFSEFCFDKLVDEEGRNVYKTMALAVFFTPFLRGLYPRATCRTPIGFYTANRERAGKDYLAGCTGLVLEGKKTEEAPLATDEDRGSGGSEELRKKITASLANGTRRIHFSNNRGKLQNAMLETITTAEQYSDRKLGTNDIVQFDNEMDFSLSGNVGIYYTPDFWYRCRPIKLFLDIEDPNARSFKIADLHGWILENRQKILSAIYTLLNDWVVNGMKLGETPFSSFADWAKYCGGFMTHHNYGNPCQPLADDSGIGGDVEGKNVKLLFELCSKKFFTLIDKERIQGITKKQIVEWIVEAREDEATKDRAPFAYFNFDERSDQTKFGNILQKYKGRVFSDVRLTIKSEAKNSTRDRWAFERVNDVNLVTNYQPTKTFSQNIHTYMVGENSLQGSLGLPNGENVNDVIKLDTVKQLQGLHYQLGQFLLTNAEKLEREKDVVHLPIYLVPKNLTEIFLTNGTFQNIKADFYSITTQEYISFVTSTETSQ